jgi:conjugative transfer pilus assembly protein TraH
MFVFQMALKAISPQIEATLNDITQKLQSMISQSKSACQTGANLAAGLLGEVGERNAQMCKTIGNSQGFFSDWAASEQGCGTGGQQASTMARSTDASQPTKSVNYSWDSINTKLPNWDVGWKQYS